MKGKLFKSRTDIPSYALLLEDGQRWIMWNIGSVRLDVISYTAKDPDGLQLRSMSTFEDAYIIEVEI